MGYLIISGTSSRGNNRKLCSDWIWFGWSGDVQVSHWITIRRVKKQMPLGGRWTGTTQWKAQTDWWQGFGIHRTAWFLWGQQSEHFVLLRGAKKGIVLENSLIVEMTKLNFFESCDSEKSGNQPSDQTDKSESLRGLTFIFSSNL